MLVCLILSNPAALPSVSEVGFCKMGMALSPDGRCKTFDESANGFTRTDGAGSLILELAAAASKATGHATERQPESGCPMWCIVAVAVSMRLEGRKWRPLLGSA